MTALGEEIARLSDEDLCSLHGGKWACEKMEDPQ